MFGVVLTAALLPCSCQVGSGVPYPNSPRGGTVDVYHGVSVSDPYRWLEDLESPEVEDWVKAQNHVARSYLDGIPVRRSLERRLEALTRHTTTGVPELHGGQYYFLFSDGEREQPMLVRASGPDAPHEVVYDPLEHWPDGIASIARTTFSPGGRYLAYALSFRGSDWLHWRIRDLENDVDLPEQIRWTKFGEPAWCADEGGFFYARYPEPLEGDSQLTARQRIYHHRLDTPQAEDRLVLDEEGTDGRGYELEATRDGCTLLVHVWRGAGPENELLALSLTDPGDPVSIFRGFDASYRVVDAEGTRLTLFTTRNAPLGRVVRYDYATPEEPARVLIPEAREPLRSVTRVGDQLVASYLHHARCLVRLFSLEGDPLGDLELPGLGTVTDLEGTPDRDEGFFRFESFLSAGGVYRFDASTRACTPWALPDVPFDASQLETRQVFCSSPDGTRVPMFVVAKKDLVKDGSAPLLLYGYGGFDVALTPRFRAEHALWLELGGIFVSVNARGGGEYGQSWYRAGTVLNKQNVFDDFIAAAEWLCEKGYTRPTRLAISGSSNGGLLVSACVNQRPGLFAAALSDVGVHDMLRYDRFTIGWAWEGDYGNPRDPDHFRALRRYSPYHNIRNGTRYPAMLVTAAAGDDRVVPCHSYKYAAALQAAQGGRAPILLSVQADAGHGAGRSMGQRVERAVDRIGFLADRFGLGTDELGPDLEDLELDAPPPDSPTE